MVRRSPGDGTIFKRASDGLWVGGIELPTTDGIRRQKRVTAKDRATVIKKLRELRRDIDAGRVTNTGSVKIGPYLDTWLAQVHRKRVKPSTFPGDVRVADLHIKPYIGGKRLDRLTPQEIREALDKVNTPSNRRRAYVLLHSALHDALTDGLTVRNAAAAVDTPKYKPGKHPAFTPEVSMHIIRTAERHSDETWATRWAAGFLTGLRESELLGLEWDRVDFMKNRLFVEWQLHGLKMAHGCGDPVDGNYPCGRNRKPSYCPKAYWDLPEDFEYRVCERNLLWTKPKSQRSDRGVPIIRPLRIMLERLKASDGYNPHNLVFHHLDGKPITQSQDQKAWKALLELAGVPHARQHTLRKTAATLLRAAQVDEQTRMELFGHATADVQRIYAESEWELQLQAMEKLTDMLALD